MTVQVNGQLIKELRIKHSYSQEKLAEIVGVNLRTIQRIETNGVAALSTRGALAAALGVKPEDLDARKSPKTNEADGLWQRWPLLMISGALVVFGAAVLAISINSATPTGLVTLPAVGGSLAALFGFILLMRLMPVPRWRAYAVLCIVVVAMIASPPAWTVRALVIVSLWATFELGILATRLRLHIRHS